MTSPIPTISDPTLHPSDAATAPTTSPDSSVVSSAAVSEDDAASRLSTRPKIANRVSSGTMIVSRDATTTTVVDRAIEEGDVRAMSPRRNSAEVEKLSEEAQRNMTEQAKTLQMSLQAIVERVEEVKTEHEKLEGGNRFLQSYIGELMSTSKITSSAPSKKGKGRSGR